VVGFVTTRGRALALVGLLVLAVLAPSAAASAGVGAQSDDREISIDYEGDAVTVANGSSQVIEGSTDLPPGTELRVTIQSTGDTAPRFYTNPGAVVTRNGTWAVAVDLSEQSAGDTFEVTVSATDGNVSTSADGEVVACGGDCADPEPEQPDPVTIDHDGENVTVANGSTQVISGTALEPTGTEIVVTVQSIGDTAPRFYMFDSAVVTEDGTWAIAFNFTGQPAGGTFSVEASTEDGSHSTTADGEIVRCGESCADTPPTDTPTPIPEQTPTATPTESGFAGGPAVSLHESAVDTVRGGTATIELRFDGADAAVVVLGGDDAGYELETVVTDADGDGSATLYVDTALAGRDGETVSVSSGDEVSVRSESTLEAALDAGEYDIGAFPMSQDGSEYTVTGTLFIAETSPTPNGTPTPTATPSETPAGDDDLTGLLVSAAIVLGGGAVALVLIRR
jgi:hypothetical protein